MKANEVQKDDNSAVKKKYGYGTRHIQTIIFFLCITVNCMDKSHIGVTIVAMTAHYRENISIYNTSIGITRESYSTNYTHASFGESYENSDDTELTNMMINNVSQNNIKRNIHTFNWPKSTQQIIVGFYYIGYCVTMLPIAFVCHRWGGKIPLQITLLINGIISIITPWLSYWGDWKAVCSCRFVQGLLQVTIFPCVHTLIAKWAPISELAKLAAFVYTGIPLGNVLAPQLGGLLADSRWGWPSTYWSVGIINLIIFCLLTVFGSETPLKHSSIKEEEKIYILATTSIEDFQKIKIPWKAILTSKPVWATIVAHVGSCICFTFFFIEVPSYIYYIYGNDVKKSGLLSSLPFLCSIFTSLLFGWLSDFVTNNNIVTIKNARRIFNTISHCGLSTAIICVSFTNNMALGVTCLIIAICADSACHVGWMVSYIDLAPNFSGLLMIMGNAFMNVCLLLLPIVVSYVITNQTDIIQWRVVFFVIAVVSIISNIVYVTLMSEKIQPWNYVDNNNCKEGKKHEDTKEKTRL